MAKKIDAQSSFELIAEYTNDVVVRVDQAGLVTYISPAIRKYGYEPDVIIGTDGIDLFHPDDRASMAANAAALIRGENDPYANRQHRFRRSDGTWAWVEGNPRVVFDDLSRPVEFLNIFRDVTERKDAQDALVESEARFRQLAENGSDIIVRSSLSDADPRVSYVSSSVAQLGWRPEEATGLPRSVFVHPDDQDRLRPTIEALINGQPMPGIDDRQFRLRHKDGRWIWFETSPSLLRDADGRPAEVISLLRDITARKAAELEAVTAREAAEALAGQAERAEALAGLGHWRFDARTGAINWSRHMYRIYGLDPDEPLDLDRLMAMTDPRDSADGAARLQNQLATGEPDSGSIVRIVNAHGEVRHLAGRSVAERASDGTVTAVVGTVLDITEQKMAELALADSELRYRGLANAAPDMICETALDGTVLYVSPACEEMFGVPASRLMNRDAFESMLPAEADLGRAACRAIVDSNGQTKVEPIIYSARHANGGQVWVESRPAPKFDPVTGKVVGFIDILRDITARKAMEEALALAKQEAEAATAVKSLFLANMSHEIRTPLTAILGFTSLLLDDPTVHGEAAVYVRRVAGAGKGLLAIVNDVLDFSKLEAGKVEVRPQPTRLAELCEETLLMFSGQAETKGLDLQFNATADVPDWVLLDGERLRQALVNLIGNAVKFTDRGTVELRLLAGENADEVMIDVQDSGPGLDTEAQVLLFERFTQIDGSATRRHGGTGLGLAISRGLVEAMGGAITLSSQPGAGACFTIAVPAPAADMPSDDPQAPVDWLVETVRVLVVDDNSANREVARRILEAAGATVIEASDGAEALERLSAQPVDVVLMDLRMPGLSGAGTLARLRAVQGPNSGVPVLAFTADAEQEGVGELSAFDGLVRKPMDPVQLLRTVAAAAVFEPSRSPRFKGLE